MGSLPPPPLSFPCALTHFPHFLSLSLSLDTVSFLLKRNARLHKWSRVKTHSERAPTDSLQALAQVYCNRLDEHSELLLTIHHLLTVD